MAHRTRRRQAPRSTAHIKLRGMAEGDVPPRLWKHLPPFGKVCNITRWVIGSWWRHAEVAVPLTVLVLTYSPAIALAAAFGTTLWWLHDGARSDARRAYRIKRQIQNAIVDVICAQRMKTKETADFNPVRGLPSWLDGPDFGWWPDDRNGDGVVSPEERVRALFAGPRQPHSAGATVKLPLGVTDGEMNEIIHQVPRRLDADCTMTLIGMGKALIRIVYSDVLAPPMAYTPTVGGARLDAMPVARNRYADVEHRALLGPNGARSWLIAGITGSGKTSLINATLADLVELKLLGVPLEIHLGDPLGGVDMGCWWQFCDEVADTAEGCLAMIEKGSRLIGERTVAMAAAKTQKITAPSVDFPPRVWVIDELADLTSHPDTNKQRDAVSALWKMLRTGRKTGDIVIVATQNISAKAIPTLVRDQFQDTIGLRTRTRAGTTVVLGDKLDEVVNLAKIPEDQQGRCWWMSGQLEELRLRGLWGDALDAQVARLQRLVGDRRQAVNVAPAATERPLTGRLDVPAASDPLPGEVSATGGQKVVRGESAGLLLDALREVNGFGAQVPQIKRMIFDSTGKVVSERTIRRLLEKQVVPNRSLSMYRYALDEEKVA